MAFRSAPNATVVGSTTAGADGNVSAIPLPGGLRSMISGIGVFYPDKRPTQRIGIIADIEATPTIQGIRSGRDEVLEVALRQILGPDSAGRGDRAAGEAVTPDGSTSHGLIQQAVFARKTSYWPPPLALARV